MQRIAYRGKFVNSFNINLVFFFNFLFLNYPLSFFLIDLMEFVQEVENVRNYYNNQKAYNMKLKAMKEEVNIHLYFW